jgi:hypothetical protein
MPAPARVVSRGLAVAGFAAAMFVAALLGAGLASRGASTPAQPHHHEIVVANGGSQDTMAREQMLIRQMLQAVRTLDRQPGHERLG